MTTEITGGLVFADRKKRKLSREKYAELVGLTKNKIMNIEQGRDIRPEEIDLLRPTIFGEGGAGLDDRDFSHPVEVVVPIGQQGLQPIEVVAPPDILELNRSRPPIILNEEDEWDDFDGVLFIEDVLQGIEDDVVTCTCGDETEASSNFPVTFNGVVHQADGPCYYTDESIVVADESTEIVEIEVEVESVPVAIRPSKYEFQLQGYHVSNSELRTFKRCKRKWWLSYYRELRLKRPDVTGPRAIGTRLHLALSGYYNNEDIWEIFNDSCQIDREKVIDDDEKLAALEKDIELCRIMLDGYLEWLGDVGADDGIEVVGNEEVIEVNFTTIRGVMVVLVGKLDLRIRRISDGLRLFLDHKSVQTLEVPTLHMDEQLLQYQLLEYLQFLETGGKDHAVGGLYNMLRKVKRSATAKPPFYARVEVRHNHNELQSYWLRVYGEVESILQLREQLDAGVDPRQVAYPTPSRDCSWDCDFIAVCPMFDDGSASEEMLAEYYESHDPHDHYYVAAEDEKTER